jgi:hypothetical protein
VCRLAEGQLLESVRADPVFQFSSRYSTTIFNIPFPSHFRRFVRLRIELRLVIQYGSFYTGNLHVLWKENPAIAI